MFIWYYNVGKNTRRFNLYQDTVNSVYILSILNVDILPNICLVIIKKLRYKWLALQSLDSSQSFIQLNYVNKAHLVKLSRLKNDLQVSSVLQTCYISSMWEMSKGLNRVYNQFHDFHYQNFGNHFSLPK